MPISDLIEIVAGSASYLDFPATYGASWSNPAQVTTPPTPILQAEVTRAYFRVKKKYTDADYWIDLDDSNVNKIAWVIGSGTVANTIRVKLGENSVGKAFDNLKWELKLKMSDGRFITLQQGDELNILPSVVGNPA